MLWESHKAVAILQPAVIFSGDANTGELLNKKMLDNEIRDPVIP